MRLRDPGVGGRSVRPGELADGPREHGQELGQFGLVLRFGGQSPGTDVQRNVTREKGELTCTRSMSFPTFSSSTTP